MMYFKALLHGMSDLPSADPELRKHLEQQAAEQGWESLYKELKAKDPVAAELIHPNNRQRLLRAVEVIRLSGKPISELWAKDRLPEQGSASESGVENYTYFTRWQADEPASLPYTVVQLAMAPSERRILHERIHRRFLAMLDAGFLEEVRALMGRGDLHPDLPSMRCVGYRQAWSYLAGEYGRQELVEKGVAATRQLAKRQLTWLRKWTDLAWLDNSGEEQSHQLLVDNALKIIQSRTTLKF